VTQPQFQRRVQMGLGEAIRRMIQLEISHANGFDVNPAVMTESKMIMDALNIQYQLDLGFDCDSDGIPDTVEIFAKSAETSCCRILPMDERPKKAKGKSRATKDTVTTPEVAEPVPTLATAPEPSVALEPPEPTTKKASKKPKGFLSTLFGGGEPE
jgi:hypothetical protein